MYDFATVGSVGGRFVSQLAYLVIREGSKWSDVFRLVPGQSVTIGRAPTNQIVVKDERCSRNHVEVFLSSGQWTLRDLESRNGTMVGHQMVRGDWPLNPGDIIRIGHTQLVFVHKLSEAFSSSADASTAVRRAAATPEPEEAAADDQSNVLAVNEPTTITHRRGHTKFLAPGKEEEDGVSKMGRAAAKLCRLAFELAKALDVATMAELALAGLTEGTQTDAGAVLLLPANVQGPPRGEQLEVIASRSSSEHHYHRVSDFLASTVMREGEAVLARNVMDDSTLGTRDSQGEILATSVICAPVRSGGQVFGLIHLYSTDATVVPDPDDLEFTLAVADTVAVAVENIRRRQELAENLTRVRTRERRAARAAGHPQRNRRPQRGDPPGGRGNRPGRHQQCHRADPRRERRGQGVGGPGRPQQQSPLGERLRVPQLRGAIGGTAGQRTVRPRARRLHRRHRAEDRQVRGRPQGHAHAR